MLDLFAGSGAVGLEALGRGVDSVLLVERSEEALRTIRAAIRQLDAAGAQVWRAELPRGLKPPTRVPGRPFDLVFADPPYDFAEFEALLVAIDDLVAGDSRVAVEHSSRVDLPDTAGSLVVETRRRYGESALTFFRRRPDRLRVG